MLLLQYTKHNYAQTKITSIALYIVWHGLYVNHGTYYFDPNEIKNILSSMHILCLIMDRHVQFIAIALFIKQINTTFYYVLHASHSLQ